MHTLRGTISIASCALTVFLISATPTRTDIEACSLLTAAEASAALGAPSVAGQRQMPESPTGCFWSDDPKVSDSSRRVALNTHTARSYQYAKAPALTQIKIEPVAGLGDDAVYQIYPNAPPFIWVLKGNTAISIRIIIGTTPRPFTFEQDKPKLLALAKAAVARL